MNLAVGTTGADIRLPGGLASSSGGTTRIDADVAANWRAASATPGGAPQEHPRAASTAPPRLDSAKVAEAHTEALLAADVYKTTANPPPGWREATAGGLQALGLDQRLLGDGTKTFFARVYASDLGGPTRYVVAFRGTRSSERADWVADAKQAFGGHTQAYADAIDVGRRLAKAGAVDVRLTGHSLGGGLASAAAVASGRPADTFNASGLSRATLTTANGVRVAKAAPNVEAFYVPGEILSAIQDGGDRALGGGLGAAAGGLLGGLPGFAGGGALGARLDAPPAYGDRIALPEAVPTGKGFIAAHSPVDKHGMDWVQAGLDVLARRGAN